MPSSSKRKGNGAEREVVQIARDAGLEAERAYASNGRALGHCEQVDVELAGIRVQVKRRKSIASYLQIPEGCDITAWREDRADWHVTIRLDDFLRLLKDADGW